MYFFLGLVASLAFGFTTSSAVNRAIENSEAAIYSGMAATMLGVTILFAAVVASGGDD